MTSRKRLRMIISGNAADRCGFWMGWPHKDTWPILYDYFGTTCPEDIRLKLRDDFRWIRPGDTSYRRPDGRAMWDMANFKTSHGSPGPLAACESVADVEKAYDWPRLEYINHDIVLQELRNGGDFYRASGFWTCFYHIVMDLMGMENYMMKMYLNPEVVHAITDRVCEFYYEANKQFFEVAGDEVDGFFFGNDFGTQLDLICGLPQFDEFILPWFKKFTDLAHSYDLQVILHSCGAIHKVIGRLVDAGVDCLHPIQARAKDMDAATLARDFKGRIAFMGGIDTQELLIHATPQQIKDEVRRVRDLLGPCLIVSPSHEALLPNVPPASVEAMAQAVLE